MGRDVKFTLDRIGGSVEYVQFFDSDGTVIGIMNNPVDSTSTMKFAILPVIISKENKNIFENYEFGQFSFRVARMDIR